MDCKKWLKQFTENSDPFYNNKSKIPIRSANNIPGFASEMPYKEYYFNNSDPSSKYIISSDIASSHNRNTCMVCSENIIKGNCIEALDCIGSDVNDAFKAIRNNNKGTAKLSRLFRYDCKGLLKTNNVKYPIVPESVTQLRPIKKQHREYRNNDQNPKTNMCLHLPSNLNGLQNMISQRSAEREKLINSKSDKICESKQSKLDSPVTSTTNNLITTSINNTERDTCKIQRILNNISASKDLNLQENGKNEDNDIKSLIVSLRQSRLTIDNSGDLQKPNAQRVPAGDHAYNAKKSQIYKTKKRYSPMYMHCPGAIVIPNSPLGYQNTCNYEVPSTKDGIACIKKWIEDRSDCKSSIHSSECDRLQNDYNISISKSSIKSSLIKPFYDSPRNEENKVTTSLSTNHCNSSSVEKQSIAVQSNWSFPPVPAVQKDGASQTKPVSSLCMNSAAIQTIEETHEFVTICTCRYCFQKYFPFQPKNRTATQNDRCRNLSRRLFSSMTVFRKKYLSFSKRKHKKATKKLRKRDKSDKDNALSNQNNLQNSKNVKNSSSVKVSETKSNFDSPEIKKTNINLTNNCYYEPQTPCRTSFLTPGCNY